LLICFALMATPAPSWSAEKEKGVFFSYSTAERLYVDLKFLKADTADKATRGTLSDRDRKLADSLLTIGDVKIKGLTQDKEEYRKEADKLRDLYIKADQDRVKAENAAPSRLCWFTAGVIATLAAIVGAFAAIR
jgi:hypothetical protein